MPASALGGFLAAHLLPIAIVDEALAAISRAGAFHADSIEEEQSVVAAVIAASTARLLGRDPPPPPAAPQGPVPPRSVRTSSVIAEEDDEDDEGDDERRKQSPSPRDGGGPPERTAAQPAPNDSGTPHDDPRVGAWQPLPSAEPGGVVRSLDAFLVSLAAGQYTDALRGAGLVSLGDVAAASDAPSILLRAGMPRLLARRVIAAAAHIVDGGFNTRQPIPAQASQSPDARVPAGTTGSAVPAAAPAAEAPTGGASRDTDALPSPTSSPSDEPPLLAHAASLVAEARSALSASSAAKPSPQAGRSEDRAGAGAPAGSAAVSDWEEFASDDGFVYYHSSSTGQTTWTLPAGGVAVTLADKARKRHRRKEARVAEARAAAEAEAEAAAREEEERAAHEQWSASRSARPGRSSDRPGRPYAEMMQKPDRQRWRDAWEELLPQMAPRLPDTATEPGPFSEESHSGHGPGAQGSDRAPEAARRAAAPARSPPAARRTAAPAHSPPAARRTAAPLRFLHSQSAHLHSGASRHSASPSRDVTSRTANRDLDPAAAAAEARASWQPGRPSSSLSSSPAGSLGPRSRSSSRSRRGHRHDTPAQADTRDAAPPPSRSRSTPRLARPPPAVPPPLISPHRHRASATPPPSGRSPQHRTSADGSAWSVRGALARTVLRASPGPAGIPAMWGDGEVAPPAAAGSPRDLPRRFRKDQAAARAKATAGAGGAAPAVPSAPAVRPPVRSPPSLPPRFRGDAPLPATAVTQAPPRPALGPPLPLSGGTRAVGATPEAPEPAARRPFGTVRRVASYREGARDTSKWAGAPTGAPTSMEFAGASRSEAVFSSSLRPGLYGPQPQQPGALGAQRAPGGGEAAPAPRQLSRSGTALRLASRVDTPTQEASGSYAYQHAATSSQAHGEGTVFDRLTDARGYTGTHRHRFDRQGRGLGLRGRDSADVDYEWVKGQALDPGGAPIFTTNDPGSLAFGVRRHH